MITSVCFFVNKWTNGKLLFARWANSKQIKENRLPSIFRFLFDVSMSPCLHVSCLHLHVSGISKRKMATSVCLLQMENGTNTLLFVCWKRKFVFFGRQTIDGNGLDDSCFSKRANYFYVLYTTGQVAHKFWESTPVRQIRSFCHKYGIQVAMSVTGCTFVSELIPFYNRRTIVLLELCK